MYDDNRTDAGVTANNRRDWGTEVRRISWGAVLAGVAIILAIQLAMALLGTGIGLSTVDPVAQESPTATTFGIAGGIYWAISIVVSVLIGGWVAGRLAGIPRDFDGLIHGVLAWSVATLLTVYLLTSSIGGLIGGAFGVVGNVAQGASQVASSSMPNVVGAVQDKLKESGVDVERLKREAQDPANKQEAERKAREAADQSAKVVSRASLFAFLALILGAAAGAIGGRKGRPDTAIGVQ